MRQALLTVFVLLSLLAAATAPAPAAAAQGDGLGPEGVTIHIAIENDGDARWTISTRYNVNDSSDERAFEDVASSFERGEGDVGFSLQTFETVIPQVQEQTGRNMSIEDPGWTSEVVNESSTRWGYLRLSFTWTNFAEVRNDTMTLGGVFRGGWFGDLDPDQTLVIEPPSGFDVSSAQPSHETVNGTLRWTGPVNFGPNEPSATFERQPEAAEVPWTSIAGAVLTALVVGGIIAYAWFWRTTRESGAGATATTDSEGGGATTGEAETTSGSDAAAGAGTAAGAGPGENAPTGGEATGSGASAGPAAETTANEAGEAGVDAGGSTDAGRGAEAGAATGAAGAATGAEAADDETDEGDAESEPVPELLSDEERVERLLEENNGRMKQAKIVEETRWSNAKVSQLLSQMAEEDRVEKLRIGRENLISLPKDDENDGRFG